MLHRLPFSAVLRDGVESARVEVVTRNELRQRSLVGGEEGLQVHRQVTDDRQVSQGLDAQFGSDRFYERAACQPFAAIHDHGAGTTHADATGKPERQVWARPALQREERIQDACLFR